MVTCSNPPPLLGQPKVCCVFNYDAVGRNIGGTRNCTPIGANQNGQDQTITEAECVAGVVYNNERGEPLPPVPYGEIKECCRDCNPPPKKLILSGGWLVRNGGALNMSPDAEPEKCCCGDECVCKQVPEGCEQVRCYPTAAPTLDDKCRGRCVIRTYDAAGNEILDDRTMICATKLQCCAEDDSTCSPACVDGSLPPVSQPARDDIPAANQWDAMPCTTCSGCCVHNYDTDAESPTFREILSRTLNREMTKEECETTLYDPDDPTTPFGKIGTWYADAQDPNICNPYCCETQQLGDKKQASCQRTSAATCNPCLGKCVDLKRENSEWLCPRSECKTKQACCGAGGEKCAPQCGSATAEYAWIQLSCSDGDKCGKCCRYVWDTVTNNHSAIICDVDTNTKTKCEREIQLPSGVSKPYGIWYPFGTCADCNPTPCCREITCPDGKTRAICVNVEPQDCNRCNGRCTDLSTLQQSCKTKQACCGNDGKKCETACGVDATHSWTAACADPQFCGACCRIVSAGANNIIAATCLPNITRAIDCVLTPDDIAAQQPNNIITYSWRPFETCATAKCAQKKCCGELCPGDVGCVDVEFSAPCDPCKGRCVNNNTGTKSCETKQACCGNDGARCRGCPANGTVPAVPAVFEWSGCNDNETKCGVCCVVTKNYAGEAVSAECRNISYDACAALGPDASWKPFETCASAICIPRTCCDDTSCANQAICVTVDKNNCSNPCRGKCKEKSTNITTCATRVDCCGADLSKCYGKCIGGSTPGSSALREPSTHEWDDSCVSSSICGVCCRFIYNSDGNATGTVCDSDTTTQGVCERLITQPGGAKPYGVWRPSGTCSSCLGERWFCETCTDGSKRCEQCGGPNFRPCPEVTYATQQSCQCACGASCDAMCVSEVVSNGVPVPPAGLSTTNAQCGGPCKINLVNYGQLFTEGEQVFRSSVIWPPSGPNPFPPNFPWKPGYPGALTGTLSTGQPIVCGFVVEAFASGGDVNGPRCNCRKYTISRRAYKIDCTGRQLIDITSDALIGPYDETFSEDDCGRDGIAGPRLCGDLPEPPGFSPPTLICTAGFTAQPVGPIEAVLPPRGREAISAKPAEQKNLVGFGPGTELKKMLAKIGITATPTCSCNSRAAIMDEKGVQWCKDNTDTIVSWLREEATKRGLPFVDLAGKIIVKRAISLAEKAEKKRQQAEEQNKAADG